MPKSYHKRNSFSLSGHYNKTLNDDFGVFNVYTSGSNSHNQLGRQSQEGDSSSPVQAFGLSSPSWKIITNSGYHAQFGIKNDNTLWAWGHDGLGITGQSSMGQKRTSPVLVFSDYNWLDVATTKDHNAVASAGVGIKTDGTLWTWGSNNHGVGGVDSNYSQIKFSSPVQVGIDTNWAFVKRHEGYSDDFSASWMLAGKTDGTLWGWGVNNHGQLGDGTTTPRSSPVQVTGLNWSDKLASFYTGFVGVKTDGTLWTCGYNGHGELGQNDTTSRSAPSQVGTLSNWSKCSAGSHACYAIKTDNTLWAWGHNPVGEIGNNSTSNSVASPVQVSGSWIDIVGAGRCAFGIKTGGTLWGWGHGGRGYEHVNLGINNTANASSPQQIGADTWTNVWGSATNVWARKSDGSIWGWGRNGGRLLGSGHSYPAGAVVTPNREYEEYINYSSPVQVMAPGGTNNWPKISISPRRVYLINSNNRLYGMGWDESLDVFSESRSSPIQIPGSWSFITSGLYSTFGIRTNGTLWHWGTGGWGQGGNRYNVDTSSPIQIGSDTDWDTVSTNYHGVYARKTNGSLYSWGHNAHGHLGQNDTTSRSSPNQIPGTWKTVGTSYGHEGWNGNHGTVYHVLATKSDDSLWAWGHNDHGQVRGDWARKNSSPIQMNSDLWQSVAASHRGNMYAVTSGGSLWSFGGANQHGQLGMNDTIPRSSPTQIPGSGWEQVQAAGHHCSALKTDDTLWMWGHNNHGQHGFGDASDRSTPHQTRSNVRMWNVWRDNSIVVQNDSNMFTVGRNNHGQLGLNNTTLHYGWQQVGSNQWRNASIGHNHAAAVRNDGTLWAWGHNNLGQVGNNTATNYSSPIQIGSLSTWSQAHCGYNQTWALKNDGTLWAWGQNNDGQLGVGNTVSYSSPVQLSGTIWSNMTITDMYQSDDNDRGHFGVIQVYGSQTNGTLWAWGKGYNYQLGQSLNVNYSSPVQIPGTWKMVGDLTGAENNTNFISRKPFAVNWQTGFAIKNDNTLQQMGMHPDDHHIPNYSTTSGVGTGAANGNLFHTAGGQPAVGNDASSPIQIMPGTWISGKAGRYRVSVALRSDNTLWTWGYNHYGQTGSGDRANRSSPIQVPGTGWLSAELGSYGSINGIRSDGTWWGIGYDGHGALGWGRNLSTSSPVQAPGSNYTVFDNQQHYNVSGYHCFHGAKEKR